MSGPPREPQVGGPVDPNKDQLYIARATDAQFLDLLRAGEFVNLITSRQMGKTSLVYRAMAELEPEGVRFAYLDLSPLRNQPEARVFFRTLVEELARDLDLAIDLDAFWGERGQKANGACLVDFFRMALAEIEGPLVVVLDEIDSTLESAELLYTDDLFTALRSIYTTRPREPAFRRLAVCLVGVATPNELIKARRTTPYNVGRTLWLADFDPAHDDLAPLAGMLGEGALLDRLLYWTGGQPYLTMWLARELKRAGARQAGDADRWVDAHFASLEKVRGEAHFEQTERFLFGRGGSAEVLDLYERILRGRPEPDQPANPVYAQLRLSGLVRRDAEGRLAVRNPIYARLFDAVWVARSRPRRQLRNTRRWAIAASVALVATVAGGLGYYQRQVAPIVSAQEARIALRDLGFDVKDQPGQTLVVIRERGGGKPEASGDANELLTRAAPYLGALGSGGEAQPLALELAGLPITDLAPLADLPRLRALGLARTAVRDIAPLARLAGLERLDLSNTPVADIAPLAGLAKLEYLDLANSQVRRLDALQALPALRTLMIDGLGIERFDKAGVRVFGASAEAPAALKWKAGETFRDCSDCPEMVVLPTGKYEMGSPEGVQRRLSNEGPQHSVHIGKPFAVGRFEVTFDQWDACTAAGGCEYQPDDQNWGRRSRPVINVSWNDAQAYLRWLSKKTGQHYRLLSEAEWEYAARAGTTTEYPWGDQDSHEYANFGEYQCCGGQVDGRDRWEYTAPVGSFDANAFGLYDMIGNIWEWVEDCRHAGYQGAPLDGDPWDAAVCDRRVLRGGSWFYDPLISRSAARGSNMPGNRLKDVGFRLARTL